ncbi:MAG: methyltransferase domain-containing protein, partial [Planctomycetota bacterium]
MNPILSEFDRASSTYQAHSEVQQEIARALANLLIEACPKPDTILELGCGTGNLTRLLAQQYPSSRIEATDASPSMLEEARRLMDESQVKYSELVIDSNLRLDSDWDLIASSMTLQWLKNLPQVIGRLADRAQTLAFALPIHGTFANWIEAHHKIGRLPGTREFVTADELRDACADYDCVMTTEDFPVHYHRPIDFVKNLHYIGGNAPRPGHRP